MRKKVDLDESRFKIRRDKNKGVLKNVNILLNFTYMKRALVRTLHASENPTPKSQLARVLKKPHPPLQLPSFRALSLPHFSPSLFPPPFPISVLGFQKARERGERERKKTEKLKRRWFHQSSSSPPSNPHCSVLLLQHHTRESSSCTPFDPLYPLCDLFSPIPSDLSLSNSNLLFIWRFAILVVSNALFVLCSSLCLDFSASEGVRSCSSSVERSETARFSADLTKRPGRRDC